jgi:hypothetical protein
MEGAWRAEAASWALVKVVNRRFSFFLRPERHAKCRHRGQDIPLFIQLHPPAALKETHTTICSLLVLNLPTKPPTTETIFARTLQEGEELVWGRDARVSVPSDMWSRLIFSGLPDFVSEVAVEQLPPRYTRIPREVKESLVFVSPHKNWRMTVEPLLPAVCSDLCTGLSDSEARIAGKTAVRFPCSADLAPGKRCNITNEVSFAFSAASPARPKVTLKNSRDALMASTEDLAGSELPEDQKDKEMASTLPSPPAPPLERTLSPSSLFSPSPSPSQSQSQLQSLAQSPLLASMHALAALATAALPAVSASPSAPALPPSGFSLSHSLSLPPAPAAASNGRSRLSASADFAEPNSEFARPATATALSEPILPSDRLDFQLMRRITRLWKTVPSDHISWLLRQVNQSAIDHTALARKLRSFAPPQSESLQDRCGLFMAVAEYFAAGPRPGLQTIDVRKGAVEWLRRHADLKIPGTSISLRDCISEGSWEEYCSRMELETEWADLLTVIAIADHFGVTLVIMSPDDACDAVVKPITREPTAERLSIGYLFPFHFLPNRAPVILSPSPTVSVCSFPLTAVSSFAPPSLPISTIALAAASSPSASPSLPPAPFPTLANLPFMAFSSNPPPPADLSHLLPTSQQDLLRLLSWLDKVRDLVVSRLSSNPEMDAISVLGEGFLKADANGFSKKRKWDEQENGNGHVEANGTAAANGLTNGHQ